MKLDKTKSLFENWFTHRFHEPYPNDSYYTEWKERYNNGFEGFIAHMDGYSFSVWQEVLSNFHNRNF